ncbi:MAG: transcriptional repressor [Lachnospiraceae bacterium]|nr:transcriptional repressor [Lachnospiraceae bacterium]
MSSRPKYKTKQREILLSYLEGVSGVHITANDVCEYFRSRGDGIGQSTIYRHLESLVDEGILKKYTIDAGSPACFEYVGTGACEDVEHCYHCKCEGCGKLIHLHCDEMMAIRDHLYRDHAFVLDVRRTVFFGLCDDCAKERKEKELLS